MQWYNVVKTNKRGVQQDRIMGIDRERIYNMMPKDGDAGKNVKRVRCQ